MQNTAFRFTKFLLAALLATAIAGCSAEAKKSRYLKRADDYFKAGEYDKARIEYTNLLRADGKNAHAYAQIGIMWLNDGVPIRAAPYLIKAKELAPERLPVRLRLAQVYQAVGAFAEARAEANEILQQTPGDEDAILILVETSRTPEELAAAEQRLASFSKPDSANFHIASAYAALRKGDIPGTEAALQRAIAADPKSWRAHLVLGNFRLFQKNPRAAGDALKMATDLAPRPGPAHLVFATWKAQNALPAEATAYMQGVLKGSPDFLPGWSFLAKLAASEKKYDEALSFLQNVFRQDAQNFEGHLLEADLWSKKGDANKAIDVLKRLAEVQPKNALVKYQLGKAHLQNRDDAPAAVALEEALAIAPDFKEAIFLLAEINLRAGKGQAVVDSMQEFLKKNPNSELALVGLADGYRALGRLDDAAAIFRQQIATSPENPRAPLLLGMILQQQKKTDEARQAFGRALELDPNNFVALSQLVDLDLTAKNFPAALARASKHAERAPESAGSHLLLAKVYGAQQDWDRAEAALLKVLELNADIPIAYQMLAGTYVAAKKLPQAATQMEAFLQKAPSNAGALMTLALIYSEMKEVEKTRDTYEKLLAIQPANVVALNNLAYIYTESLPQLDRANELALKARTADPGDGLVAGTLGWVHYKRGEYQQAIPLLRESASKVPNSPEVQYHLGMANYMMGEEEAARSGLRRALSAGTDFPGKAEAQRRLALLEESGSQAKQLSAADLEAMLKDQPKDVLVLARLGREREKQGEFAKAAQTYEEVFALNPKLPGIPLSLAQLYAGPLKSPDKAIEFAKKARELAPNDPAVKGALGRIALGSGNYSWAYSVLQESARQRGSDPRVHHDLAIAAYALGKVPEARDAMQQSIDAAGAGTESDNARRFLAFTLPDAPPSELARLESQAQEILKTEPDYVPALMVQAALQLENKEPARAADLYLSALARYPDFAPAQKHLAAIYADTPDQIDKAHDLALKARKVLTDDPALSQTLGELSYKRKDFRYSVQLFQQSSAKKPLGPKHLFYLGMAQLQTNQQRQGRDTLQSALAAGLEEPLAAQARQEVSKEEPAAAK